MKAFDFFQILFSFLHYFSSKCKFDTDIFNVKMEIFYFFIIFCLLEDGRYSIFKKFEIQTEIIEMF